MCDDHVRVVLGLKGSLKKVYLLLLTNADVDKDGNENADDRRSNQVERDLRNRTLWEFNTSRRWQQCETTEARIKVREEDKLPRMRSRR